MRYVSMFADVLLIAIALFSCLLAYKYDNVLYMIHSAIYVVGTAIYFKIPTKGK